MDPISTEQFFERAKSFGIGFDPRYPNARSLIYLAPNEASRFWTRPDPSAWPHFVATLLDSAGVKNGAIAYPRTGWWRASRYSVSQRDRTLATLAAALGLPDGWEGAIAFDAADRERLIAVLVVHLLDPFDLYVLPTHGKALLEFGHHDVVHVSTPDEAGIESVIQAMAAAKYTLPETLPDATFKRPGWMKS